NPLLTFTVNISVDPASADCTVYLGLVATPLHVMPVASQRHHFTAETSSGDEPVHEPWSRTNTCPTCGAPESVVVSYAVAPAARIFGRAVEVGSELACGSLNPSC